MSENKYPDGYWEYIKKCDQEKSYKEREVEKRKYEEYQREKNRVW
jgi:hypothetical protein